MKKLPYNLIRRALIILSSLALLAQTYDLLTEFPHPRTFPALIYVFESWFFGVTLNMGFFTISVPGAWPALLIITFACFLRKSNVA